MRLTLNHWPALASHLGAVILGIGLANLRVNERDTDWRLAVNSTLMRLDVALLERATAEPDVVAGTRLHLGIRNEDGTAACRWSRESVVLELADRKPVVRSALGQTAGLIAQYRRAEAEFKGKLVWLRSAQAGALPMCARTPQVSYGG